jgi:hypothetical protein
MHADPNLKKKKKEGVADKRLSYNDIYSKSL